MTSGARRRARARFDAEPSRGGALGARYHDALTRVRAAARAARAPRYLHQAGGVWWASASQPPLPYVKVHPDERAIKHERAAGDPRRFRPLRPDPKLPPWARRRAHTLTRRETRLESDDEVRRNIPAHLHPLWSRVKGQIRAGGRRSRTEAFLHYVHENPGEEWAGQERQLDAIEREMSRRQNAPRRDPSFADWDVHTPGGANPRTRSHRYAIYGLVKKSGGGFLKKRYLVARARDAGEAATEIYRLQRGPGHGWTYMALDLHAARGKLAPLVSYEELVGRSRAGKMDPRRRSRSRRRASGRRRR